VGEEGGLTFLEGRLAVSTKILKGKGKTPSKEEKISNFTKRVFSGESGCALKETQQKKKGNRPNPE